MHTKTILLISLQNIIMLWFLNATVAHNLLKITMSIRRFLKAPKNLMLLMDKKIITNLKLKTFSISRHITYVDTP